MSYREFTHDGVDWVVYEVTPRAEERREHERRQHDEHPDAMLDRRGDDRRVTVAPTRPVRLTMGWLCFEGSGERRRLQPVPEDWRGLPDAQLSELLLSAKAAPYRKHSLRPGPATKGAESG